MAASFGDRLKQERTALARRKKRKVTQGEVGAAVGVTGGTVSKWERGIETNPTDANLKGLAALFGVRVEWLWEGQEPRSATVNRANAPGEVLADLRTAIDAARHYVEELEAALATRTPETLVPGQAEALLVEATDAESGGEPLSGQERPA